MPKILERKLILCVEKFTSPDSEDCKYMYRNDEAHINDNS